MKTKLFLALISIATYGYGIIPQPDPKIPTIVKENFKKQYPNIKDVDWEKENEAYEAEFEIDDIDYAVSYNAMGNLVKTEVAIKTTALPKPTLDYLSKNAPGKKIKEVTKVILANGEVLYEVEVGDTEYLFEANGAFIKQKVGAVNPNDPD